MTSAARSGCARWPSSQQKEAIARISFEPALTDGWDSHPSTPDVMPGPLSRPARRPLDAFDSASPGETANWPMFVCQLQAGIVTVPMLLMGSAMLRAAKVAAIGAADRANCEVVGPTTVPGPGSTPRQCWLVGRERSGDRRRFARSEAQRSSEGKQDRAPRNFALRVRFSPPAGWAFATPAQLTGKWEPRYETNLLRRLFSTRPRTSARGQLNCLSTGRTECQLAVLQSANCLLVIATNVSTIGTEMSERIHDSVQI